MYSWERGFEEDKFKSSQKDLTTELLRRFQNRKSGATLTNPLENLVVSETSTTVTTAAGSIYRESDKARSKIGLPNSGSKGGQKDKVKSPLEEPKRKNQLQEIGPSLENKLKEE